jgi:hypothetical protein
MLRNLPYGGVHPIDATEKRFPRAAVVREESVLLLVPISEQPLLACTLAGTGTVEHWHRG